MIFSVSSAIFGSSFLFHPCCSLHRADVGELPDVGPAHTPKRVPDGCRYQPPHQAAAHRRAVDLWVPQGVRELVVEA